MTSDAPTPLDRDRIVETAGNLIDAEGGDQLTMARIAAELDVTQPALYRHVDGVHDLWRALGLQTRRELAKRLTSASVGRSGPNAVSSIAAEWRKFALEHPGRYRSTERVAVSNDAELSDAVEQVLKILMLSLRGFGLTGERALHNALTLRSALHGAVTFELGDGFPASHDPGDSFGHMVDVLCQGFSTNDLAASDDLFATQPSRNVA